MKKEELKAIIEKRVKEEEYTLKDLNLISYFLKDIGEETLNWEFGLLEVSKLIDDMKSGLFPDT